MKYILFIILFIAFESSLKAQELNSESNGTIQYTLGGSVGANFSNRYNLLEFNSSPFRESTSNTFNINFRPYLALTTSKKHLFGISPIIGYTRSRFESVNNGINSFSLAKSWRLGGQVFFRNYFNLNDRLNFFASTFISYTETNTDREAFAPTFLEERTVLGSLGISTGFTFDLNENWKLLTSFWSASLRYNNFNSPLLDENQIDFSLSTGLNFSNIRFGVERILDFSKK